MRLEPDMAAALLAKTAPPWTAADLVPVLTPIWRRAFGPKGHAPDAHVMRMSVGIGRVTRFLDGVEDAIGVRVPATALMRLGTIELLAVAIARNAWPSPSAPILLRDGAGSEALYVIAAGTGLVLELCDLAQAIPFPGPIWALQLPGLDGETTPLADIGAMAAHHIAAIRAQHSSALPAGPVHLIGYSFGGLVCVEMARLLGDRIGLLGLIDTTCYETYWPRTEWLRVAGLRTLRRMGELRGMRPRPALQHLAGRGRAMAQHIGRRFKAKAGDADFTRSVYYVDGLDPRLQAVRDASIIAFERHDPAPIDAPVTLFKSRLGDRHGCDPARLWRRLAGRLDVVMVEGTHTTMLRKPHVEGLAAAIGARLGSQIGCQIRCQIR